MAEQTWTISAIPAGALVGNPRSIFEVGADEISNERVTADLAGANYAIYPTNLQYFTGGFGTTLSLDLSSTPAGNTQVSDEMSATFERQGVITITIGGHELTLTIGTDTNRDTGEPYSWTLTSAARTRGNAWLAQLSVGDTGTFTLSDGVTSTDHVIATAGTPEWDFETTEPTVTVRTARHIIATAGTPEWGFETTEPTVTHRTTQHVIATAGTPEWDFETTEPTVTHRTTRHTIASAGTPEWDFETTEPSVTLTAAAPVTTTEHAYRLAQTLEATDLPSSTAEAVPTGWSATEPARTATESVYRLSSDVTRLRGVFVSRTAWAWSPAFASQPYRRSINSLSRYIRKFVTNVRHKDSGAQASVVVAIQADPPEGIGYRELTIYQTVTLAANAPAAPAAPEWDGTTLSAIGSWSVTFPTYDPNTHRVACAIVLVSTENTAEVIGTVAFCESPGDLNAVFVRSETQPTRLTDSATRLPDNTYDTQGNVPAGDGHIYVAIGNRPPNGTTWTWSAWDQLEGTDGQDGRDGAPGASGIAQRFAVNLGTALPDNNSEIRLRNGATNIDSLTDANAADVDTIQVGISTGTAEATVRRRRGYGGLGGADVVTVREAADQGGNSKFVDYEVTAVSPSPLTGTTRTATLTVSHIEHRLPSAIEGTAVFGISRSLDGIDGIPGTRGLVGYAKSLTRSTRAANAGAVNSATEWFLSGSTANWTGNRTLTVGVSAAEEAELKRVGIGALLTAYDDSDNWADYTLRSAATFTGTGATRAAALSLAHREGFGSPPTTGAVELHYTPAGQDGEDGVSTALVTIWKRSATQPTDTPADGATYTYATGALTGTLNSWVAGTPPAGTNRLWARVASVRGRTATATIDATDWSGVVHDEGADGISTANVTIYQRADAQPTAPARSVRHTFATGANVWTGAGAQNGWQLNIAGTSTQTGTKLWIAHAAAAGDGATDDIASSEWSVGQLAEKGDKGDPGTAGGLNTVYRRATTQPATPTAGTADIPTSWSDDPPTGTNQLWASNGSEDPDTNIWTWQTPRKAFERTDAPTVTATATGDDVRIVVTDPTNTTGIIGHRIDLERLENGDWRTVDTVTHVGLTTNRGRGKTFAELEAGQYRAEVQTAVSPGFIESAYVVSSTVTSAGGTVTADNIPAAPPTPTAVYSEVERTVTVEYQDPPDNGGSHLVAFITELYKDGQLSVNRVAAERKGVLQGRSYIFRDITAAGVYYARTTALNANNGSPDRTTEDKNWSDFSAPVIVGDVEGIVNKVTALTVGEVYKFESTSSAGIFRVTSGGGSILSDGTYTAPENPSSEVRVGLFIGGKEEDFNEFSVSLSGFTYAIDTDRDTRGSGDQASRPRVLVSSSGYRNPRGANFIHKAYRSNAPDDIYGDILSDDNRIFPSSIVDSSPTYFVGLSLEAIPPSSDSAGNSDNWEDGRDITGSGGIYKRSGQTTSRLRIWLSTSAAAGISRNTSGQISIVQSESIQADFVGAFETTGSVRFRWVASNGSSTSATVRAKGAGPVSDEEEPYIWYLTETENADVWNNIFSWSEVTSDAEWAASQFFIDFIPDTSTGTPSGSISNKLVSLDEGGQHQYEISSLVGGVATFIAESDNVLVSADGVVIAKEVSATTAADSETVGVYVRGQRVDSDSFRINAVAEKGTIANKISELYVHQSHRYSASGVQGGSASYRIKTGRSVWLSNNLFEVDDTDDVTSPTTVVIEQLVGGVVTDSDTFTLFPAIARIANKIEILQPSETHRFRPAANRAPGTITWMIDGGGGSDSIDSNGVYTPAPSFSGGQVIVDMLLDGVVVDSNRFWVPGTNGSLVVKITNPIEAIEYGGSHTFRAEITGRNLTGARTVTWQTVGNDNLFGTTTKLTNELQARYDAPGGAPSIATFQGFAAQVQVIVEQSDSNGNSHTSHASAHFWVSPSFDLNPPTVEIFVTQDDVRIIVFDAHEQYPGQSGYRLKLQRKSGDSWTDVETVSISGAVGSEQGAGRTFNNLGAGVYRGAAMAIADGQASDSEEVFTEEVEIDRDYPDLIAGAPSKPTLTRRGLDLILNYQDPSDDGGTHLIRFAMEVYRDGTELANRIGSAQVGVRLGREKVWYNFAGISGAYRARAAAVNANSQDGGPLNWSPMSDPVIVT